MQSSIREFRGLNATIVGISADTHQESQQLAKSAGLDFLLLADPEVEVISKFGLRHVGASVDGRDIARPAIFIINRDGEVVWRMLTDNWRVRARPKALLKQLEALP